MAKNNVYNFIRVKGDEEEVKRMMAAGTDRRGHSVL